MTDEEIIALRDDMTKMAHIAYDQLMDAMSYEPIEPDDSQYSRDLGLHPMPKHQLRRERIEDVLWSAHAHRTGEHE
jgi:hypothetical protein